jgi:anaerobic selenocysteine-containing dehydrogenase
VLTKHGKVELAPVRFVQALAQLAAEGEKPRSAFTLITKRERASHNSWLHNVEALVRGNRDSNHLYVHPEDAAALALVDGGLCEVSSATGSLRVAVRLSDELMRGTVALPHGWGHAEADGLTVASRTRGVNANLLSPDGPDALERLSGMARLTAIEVQLRAVAAPAG